VGGVGDSGDINMYIRDYIKEIKNYFKNKKIIINNINNIKKKKVIL